MSKTIAQSEQLGRVSLQADYLFSRCLPHLDREGRMTGNPELVRSLVCPLRPEMTVEAVRLALVELSGVDLVAWYEVGARQCLAFPGFDRHQKGLRKDRESPSRFPAPDDPKATNVDVSIPIPTNSATTPESSGVGPANVMQGKASELKGSSSSDTSYPASRADNTRDPQTAKRLLMPVVRKRFWIPDGKPAAEWSEGRECSVIEYLVVKRGLSVDELLTLAEGLTLIRDANGVYCDTVDWVAPSEKLSFRMLIKARSGAVVLMEHARRAYWTKANRRPTGDRGTGPSGVDPYRVMDEVA